MSPEPQICILYLYSTIPLINTISIKILLFCTYLQNDLIEIPIPMNQCTPFEMKTVYAEAIINLPQLLYSTILT